MTTTAPTLTGVDRTLRLIRLLAQRPGGSTLDELSRALSVPKSSVHRLLVVLRAHGFAAQPVPAGPYFLGPAIVEAAFGFYDGLDLRAMVRPLLIAIRDEFNETTHLAVLDGGDVIYVDKVEADHTVRLTSTIGGRNPAYVTAVGKAILASTLPDDAAVTGWLARHPLETVPRTPKTARSADELADKLGRVRDVGWSFDDEESEVGVRCVAVPLFFGAPTPVAAVSVTAPKERLKVTDAERIGRKLRAITHEFAPVPPQR
ncbi:MAG TPA: IclR family transcriptional regulator [Actinomycetes bacterium]|nr:IclR family transcriptional regulator [Actinomycetes bacterium]